MILTPEQSAYQPIRAEGLSLVREVLCERRSVETVGRLRGAGSARELRWFGILFRKCLALLAAQFGFATSIRRPLRPLRYNGLDGGDGIPDTNDPALHAGDAELADPALRRGRPNGASNV